MTPDFNRLLNIAQADIDQCNASARDWLLKQLDRDPASLTITAMILREQPLHIRHMRDEVCAVIVAAALLKIEELCHAYVLERQKGGDEHGQETDEAAQER